MGKSNLNNKVLVLLKVILTVISFVALGAIFSKFLNYSIKDSLFIEGLALIISGILASIGESPSCLTNGTLGQINSNANLEVIRMEKQRLEFINSFRFAYSTIILIVSGFACLLINYVI